MPCHVRTTGTGLRQCCTTLRLNRGPASQRGAVGCGSGTAKMGAGIDAPSTSIRDCKMSRSIIVGIATFFICATCAHAHSGGLNAEGCHTNRKTGEYHCHRAPTKAAPRSDSGSSDGTYFRNCAAARAAGKAPLRLGDPGYRKPLDRDGDGVACE